MAPPALSWMTVKDQQRHIGSVFHIILQRYQYHSTGKVNFNFREGSQNFNLKFVYTSLRRSLRESILLFGNICSVSRSKGTAKWTDVTDVDAITVRQTDRALQNELPHFGLIQIETRSYPHEQVSREIIRDVESLKIHMQLGHRYCIALSNSHCSLI